MPKRKSKLKKIEPGEILGHMERLSTAFSTMLTQVESELVGLLGSDWSKLLNHPKLPLSFKAADCYRRLIDFRHVRDSFPDFSLDFKNSNQRQIAVDLYNRRGLAFYSVVLNSDFLKNPHLAVSSAFPFEVLADG